jgi:hypothetical protein
MELTPSEKRIVDEVRTLKPFESMNIVADKDGKPGVFFTTRTTKAILILGTMNYVK